MKYKLISAQEYCERVADGTHDSPKASPSTNFLITSKHISEFNLDKRSANTISDEDFIKINKRSYVSQYDILISMIGTVGRTYLVLEEKIDYAIKNLGLFSTGGDFDKSLWLYYYLQSPKAKSFISQNMRGSTQQYLPLNALRNFPIIVLENEELMNNITKVLFSLDKKIQINIKIMNSLENLTSLLFKHWFIDFEFPNEEGQPYKSSGGKMVESELGIIPKEFQVSTFESISEVMSGATPSRKKDEYFTDLGIPWITPKDLSLNKNLFIVRGQQDITKDGFENSSTKLIPKNSILFSSRAPIGYIAINTKEVTTNQGFKSFVPNNANYREYIYLILKYLTPEIEANASGSTFKEISGSALKKFKIIVPNDRTISEFASLISPIFEKIFVMESENKKLTQLRDILLPKLLSGEIEVPVKEPENV